MPLRPSALTLLATLAVATAPACARHSRAGNRAAPVSQEPVSLEVQNNHWLDVVLYVVHDGQRTRLGTATAARTTTFRLPSKLLGQLGEIRLIADPVGERGVLSSEAVVVKPGTRVVWTLESDLTRSSLAVY